MNNLDQYTFHELKKTVMATAGFSSMTPAYCHKLAKLINEKTGLLISPTTVKRIYGFASSATQTSYYTLDVLAKFCGQPGWKEWVAHIYIPQRDDFLLSSGFEQLFNMGLQPMWIIDQDTLFFKEVNEAAIRIYGYDREQFLTMRTLDIRPKDDQSMLINLIKDRKENNFFPGPIRHILADGTIINVAIISHLLPAGDERKFRLIVPLLATA